MTNVYIIIYGGIDVGVSVHAVMATRQLAEMRAKECADEDDDPYQYVVTEEVDDTGDMHTILGYNVVRQFDDGSYGDPLEWYEIEAHPVLVA
jgi:hypothetical protein